MHAVSTLSGHIRNTRSPGAAGTQPWTTDRQLALLRDNGDRFPALAAAIDGAPGDSRSARAFGLRCILDGLARLI